MNYASLYERLIQRALHRVVSGYVERHHIIPRCIGGSNRGDNLATLTAREHYIAHQLLVKMYPGNLNIARAAVFMAKSHTLNGRAAQWLRQKKADAQRGKPISEKARATLIECNRNRVFTPELRERMAMAQRGKRLSEEGRKKLSDMRRGKPKSPTHRANLSAHCKQMGMGNRGNKRKVGTTHTIESRLKVSVAKLIENPSPNTINQRRYRERHSLRVIFLYLQAKIIPASLFAYVH